MEGKESYWVRILFVRFCVTFVPGTPRQWAEGGGPLSFFAPPHIPNLWLAPASVVESAQPAAARARARLY